MQLLLALVLALLQAANVQAAKYEQVDGAKVVLDPNNGTLASKNAPKIFIYDFPAKYKNNEKFQEIVGGCNTYALDLLLPWMAKQSPYVTTNPEEADYFLVDAALYWKRMEGSISELRQLMRQAGPWWDRKHGHDHILVSTCDDGRGWYASPELFNTTMLHHYGGMAGEDIQLLHHCNLRKRWGDECDWAMAIGTFAATKKTFAPNHIPGRDMVVPSPGFEERPSSSPYINPDMRAEYDNKTSILFYAGEIDVHGPPNENGTDREGRTHEPWSDAYYSMGGRQTTYRVVGEKPFYAIHTSHSHKKGLDYFAEQRKSIFCLGAAGWGWGMRMKIGIVHGCLPVIVQDGIRTEWEEHVPMKDYAIRVPIWMAHKMDEILKLFIRTGRVARMQKVMECAWRLHWWRRPHGRAFEVLMCELKRRKLGIPPSRIKMDWDRCSMWCGDDKEVFLAKEGVWHNV